MRFVVGFARFWYDFIVGDDWRIAAGVVTVLALGAIAVAAGVTGNWLAPAIGLGFVLTFSLPVLRAGRARATNGD
jgi:hypothetical protein